jgi:hypothetical protein
MRGHQDIAERREPPDAGVFGDREHVVEDERTVEAVVVGDQPRRDDERGAEPNPAAAGRRLAGSKQMGPRLRHGNFG